MPTPFDPIFVDEYALDKPADWSVFAAAGQPWSGAVLKVSQGLHYNSGSWLVKNWSALEAARKATANLDFFRGAYHYLTIADSGQKQAEYYLGVLNAAGGFKKGDLWPIVDVESASNGNPAAQQIIDCTSSFAETIKRETGRQTMLYGGSFLYDHAIKSRMGCSYLWIARYTATLPANVYERIGWSVDALWGWQYASDDFKAQLKTPSGVTYPDIAPGCGDVDLTVLTYPGGLAALRTKLWSEPLPG